jgi:hypothetical protein
VRYGKSFVDRSLDRSVIDLIADDRSLGHRCLDWSFNFGLDNRHRGDLQTRSV